MKSIDAPAIARAIYKHWLSKYGMPQILLSDNGAYFNAQVLHNICRICGIRRVFSPPYHQQANGLIERTFQTMKQLLSAIVSEFKKDWDEVLPIVEMALRCSRQKTTGYSPFEILFGTTMRLPADWTLDDYQEKIDPATFIKKTNEIRSNMNMIINQSGCYPLQQKKYFKKEIRVGDLVLVKQYNKVNTIPQEKYVGPYKVVEKQGNVTYIIRCTKTQRKLTRHINDLKLAGTHWNDKEMTPAREERKSYPLRNRQG